MKKEEMAMIPKIIHYCWFGGSPKSELVKKCIASWQIVCPDYEIIEWNEANYDITKIPFVKEAYEAKKWAFVSDYARLDIIFNNGGIYLDTDVELFAAPDEWLQYEALFAFETGRNIATGLGFAAKKRSEAVDCMRGYYHDKHFIVNGKTDMTPCPVINTEALCSFSENFRRDGTTQLFKGVKIISSSEYSQIAKHHYAGSWTDVKTRKTQFKKTKLKSFLRNPSNFEFVKKHFGKRALDLYTFFSYDLQEYGIMHFIKRIIKKLNI